MDDVPLWPAAAIQRGPSTVAMLNSSTSQKPMVLRNCDFASRTSGAELSSDHHGYGRLLRHRGNHNAPPGATRRITRFCAVRLDRGLRSRLAGNNHRGENRKPNQGKDDAKAGEGHNLLLHTEGLD